MASTRSIANTGRMRSTDSMAISEWTTKIDCWIRKERKREPIEDSNAKEDSEGGWRISK